MQWTGRIMVHMVGVLNSQIFYILWCVINWLSGNRTSGTSSIKGRISFLRGKKFNVLLFQTLHFDEKNQICIYLTISNTEHLFMSLLAICISSLEKCLFRSAAHFLFHFLYWSVRAISILWRLLTCQPHYLQIFSPIL